VIPGEETLPRVVVTGASGWIGTALLAHLAGRLGEGWQNRVSLFGSSARIISTPGGDMPVVPLGEMTGDDVRDAIVVHLAYLTKEKAVPGRESDFTRTNAAIDEVVLRAIAEAAPRSLFVASSGAAMLAGEGRDGHAYGLSKLAQEERFLAAAQALAIPVLVGRIFNLAGPYINKTDSYAIGAFSTQALVDGTVVVAARVPVFRSFLHVDDLCALIIGAGVARLSWSGPVDFCGAEVLEMGDIAARVARSIDEGIPVVRETVDLADPSIYIGKATDTKLVAMALGLPLRPFDQQVSDTVRYIAQLHGKGRPGLSSPPGRTDNRLGHSQFSRVAVAPSLQEADHMIDPSHATDGDLTIEVRRK
jgi:nucleoside-diphosphate-sugar epimerase